MVTLKICFDGFPWLLWNDQQADTKLGHYRHRFRRYRRSIDSPFERFEGKRANLAAWLPRMRTAFHVTLFERVHDQLSVLDKEGARFVLIDSETVVFNRRETATHPEDEPAVRHVVEHRD